jgi:hypothetical protein
MENLPNKESIKETLSRIDDLTEERRNNEALRLIESLPNNEEKYIRVAYVGQNYVESGDLDKANELVELLSQSDDSLPYAGGVLELILRKTGEIE